MVPSNAPMEVKKRARKMKTDFHNSPRFHETWREGTQTLLDSTIVGRRVHFFFVFLVWATPPIRPRITMSLFQQSLSCRRSTGNSARSWSECPESISGPDMRV